MCASALTMRTEQITDIVEQWPTTRDANSCHILCCENNRNSNQNSRKNRPDNLTMNVGETTLDTIVIKRQLMVIDA